MKDAKEHVFSCSLFLKRLYTTLRYGLTCGGFARPSLRRPQVRPPLCLLAWLCRDGTGDAEAKAPEPVGRREPVAVSHLGFA